MALPARYRGATMARSRGGFGTRSMHKSVDPLGVGGDRGRVIAQKLKVSAPFRFASDDPLGVGRRSRRARPRRGVKTSSFATSSLRMVCRNAKRDEPIGVGRASWSRKE